MKTGIHVFIATTLVLAALSAGADPGAFSPPESVTASDNGAKYRLSQSAQCNLAVSPSGAVNLIYWEGLETTALASPNRIWFREWTGDEGWGNRVRVDQSTLTSGDEIGGRHPAFAINEDGDLFAVWHDHRHCSSSGGYINNLEIYGDFSPAGGSFSSTDTRLTETSNGTNGDNGYVPRPFVMPDGRWGVVWYDYDFGDAEICLRLSQSDGSFDASETIEDFRLTDSDDWADENAGDFVMPSAASDGDGLIHIVWGTRVAVTMSVTLDPDLYYGVWNPETSDWTEAPGRLGSNCAGYADPASIIYDDATGTVWLVYTDHETYGNDEIMLLRRPAGADDFEDPIRITSDSARQYAPSIASGADGTLHCVYLNGTTTSAAVEYVKIAAEGVEVPDALELSDENGAWRHPAIAVGADGGIYAAWEQYTGTTTGAIWFTHYEPDNENAVAHWESYE